MADADKARREQLKQFQARQELHRRAARRKRKDQWVWTIAALVTVAFSGVGLWAYDAIGPGKPAVVADASLSEYRTWSGTLAFAEVDLSIELYGALAPQAVANFVDLSDREFFVNTPCHRLTTDRLYVMQCGDPLGLGIGNAGFIFGPVENAPEDGVYPRGTIAMARSANDGFTMGSQFFIVYQESTIPDDIAGGYTVLGQVTEGLDAFIDSYVAPGTANQSTDGPPAVPVLIKSITIR